MTREIQDQQLTAERRHSSHYSFPAQITKQQGVKSGARPAPAHHAPAFECKHHLGEEKANRNIRISEIELCVRKHATKQFSNRNKNAFFGLLNGFEIGEKRS
jgi:hypothetical protein